MPVTPPNDQDWLVLAILLVLVVAILGTGLLREAYLGWPV